MKKSSIIIISGLLIFFLILWSERSQQQTYSENIKLLSLFTELSKSESAVNQSLLSAYSGSLSNYDVFTLYEKRSALSMHQIFGKVPEIRSNEIEFKLKTLNSALNSKWLNVEKFKAHNANLKNSISYLPSLVKDLESEIDPEELHEVLELCYLFTFGVGNVNEQDILYKLVDFKRYAASENQTRAKKINNFCLHVENILLFKTNTKHIIDEVQKLPIEKAIKLLVAEVTTEYERRRAFGENVTYILYFFSVTLLLLVIRFLWNLEKSEEKLLLSNAELEDKVGASTKELLEQNKTLLQLNEKNENLIKVLAHDIRSPLSHINGLADVLKNDNEKQSQGDKLKYLDHIKTATKKVVDIADDLLISYRPDVLDSNTPKSSIVAINEVIQESILTFEKEVNRKNIALSFHEPDGVIYCLLEKTKLYQVLNNLISNAMKFSPLESEVFISLSLDKPQSLLLIEVSDQGPGISENEQHKLFQEYPNLSPTPTDGETSIGLGLAITKNIVQGMGGKVYHKNRDVRGSTFSLEFKCTTPSSE